jgi:hypothetical protein
LAYVVSERIERTPTDHVARFCNTPPAKHPTSDHPSQRAGFRQHFRRDEYNPERNRPPHCHAQTGRSKSREKAPKLALG